MSASIRETAEFFRLMLLLGWTEKSAVVAWANEVILNQSEPDPVLLEVALSYDQPTSRLGDVLKNVSGALRPDVPALMLFAYAWHKLRQGDFTHEQAIYDLYRLADKNGSELPEPHIDAIEDLEIALSHAKHHAGEDFAAVETKLHQLYETSKPYDESLPKQCI